MQTEAWLWQRLKLGGVPKCASETPTSRILVTAALPYVYKPRHFGHLAGVYLPADIYARYNRLRGRELLFVCGTDENAATTILEARRRSTTPRELSDHYHPFQEEVFRKLGISFDIFSRTSRSIHHRTVWDFYEQLEKRNLIYQEDIRQPFCERCEEYLPDRFVKGKCPRCGAEDQFGDSCESCAQWFDASELVDARCTLCGSKPTHKVLRHSFLKLSKLQDQVTGYVESTGRAWRKRTYRRTISWLKEEGLKDRDITRNYEWGPPAPFLEDGQVIYNWAENLLGYISAARDWAAQDESKWKTYWKDPGTKLVCFLGKDNLFFHTILFPALLLGHGGYELPSQVVVNEFVTLSGSKMSASRGHLVSLHELLAKLDPEVLRYYAAAIAPENRDTVFSWEDLVNRVNTDLADSIGNLVNRVLVLERKFFGERPVPQEVPLDPAHELLIEEFGRTRETVEAHIEGFEFKKALEEVVELSRRGNRFLNERRPWENPEDAPTTIWCLLKLLATLAVLLYPFLPTTGERIWEALGHEDAIGEGRWSDSLCAIPTTPSKGGLILFKKISLDDLDPEEGRKI